MTDTATATPTQTNALPLEIALSIFPRLEAISRYKSISTRESGKVLRAKEEFEALPPVEQTKENKHKKIKEASIVDLALEAYLNLLENYELPSEANGLKVWSGSRQASKVVEELEKMKTVDDGLQRRMETTIGSFRKFLNVHCSAPRKAYNDSLKSRVEERSSEENRREVDLTEYLKQAHTVLTLTANNEKVSWKDVACALALVTGRRQAEVMASGKFSHHSEYEVIFSGQLKTKGHRDIKTGILLSEVEHVIKTLVPAHLVIAGIKWLEANGKRVSNPDKVNGLHGRYLSEAVSLNWKIDDEFTFHGFRGLYVEACMHNGKIDTKSYPKFARAALCDESPGAVNSYIRFDLVEGSLTKI